MPSAQSRADRFFVPERGPFERAVPRDSAPRPLPDRLTPEQSTLLLEVALPFVATWEWPTWDYVQRTMRKKHGLDAREILRSLPRVGAQGTLGPSYGYTAGGDWRMMGPADRVRLTIAAALPLGELRTILGEPFLRVLHHMVTLQNATVPSPNEVTEVWLDPKELAVAIPGLKDEFLLALPDILSGEPGTWGGGFSQQTQGGPWRKGIRENIDDYADAKTLETYVARTCELIEAQAEEARRQYQPPPIVFDLAGVQVPTNVGGTTLSPPDPGPLDPGPLNPELVYLPRLLLWLTSEEDGTSLEKRSPRLFVEQEEVPDHEIGGLVDLMIERRLAEWDLDLSEQDEVLLRVTDAGLAEAAAMRADLDNRAHRHRFARSGVIRWLLEVHDGGPAEATDFLWSSNSFLHGHTLTRGEIDAAVTYLLDRGLLAAVGEGYRLTADGQDCALDGGNVNDFRSQPKIGGDTNFNFHAGVQGGVFGGQHETVNQTNNFGPDLAEVSQLVQAAVLARQIAVSLNLPEAEHAAIVESAKVLELEAGTPSPDKGRLRRAADGFMAAVATATTDTAALTVLVETAKKAYSAVFGG